MTGYQLQLPLSVARHWEPIPGCQDLPTLLDQDLNFHDQDSGYGSHNVHAFPAKFPPQLPRKFIEGLTQPGEVVLDPMVGSGTTVLEAFLAGRQGLGYDIDPLALLISKVKVTPIDPIAVLDRGKGILEKANAALSSGREELAEALKRSWNPETQQFVDYWFAAETQLELQALASAIQGIDEPNLRSFFEVTLSSIIITKTGGVSLAFDLAHTRPHRAKIVLDRDGKTIEGQSLSDALAPRAQFLTKTLRPTLGEFAKRLERNLAGLQAFPSTKRQPLIAAGNAQRLPLAPNSVDLIVTSPPYASNAIDYMRAHKFSLVWMGYSIGHLGQKRKEYIGAEAVTDVDFEELPDLAATVVAEIHKQDEKKARVLHRYYSEMTRTLREMYRVLRPGKSALVVVGSSIMRGKDTRTDLCLAEIGRALGFEVPRVGVRDLDRNRRMMPAGMKLDLESQIQQRMHQEFVIGLQRPAG
jgi:DNA modification methylase